MVIITKWSLLDNLGVIRIAPAILDLFIIKASRGYVVIDTGNFQRVHPEGDRKLLLSEPEATSPRLLNSKDSNWLSVLVVSSSTAMATRRRSPGVTQLFCLLDLP